MSSIPQKAWAEGRITDTDQTTGWNYPRCYVGNGISPSASDDETLGFWYGSIWTQVGGSSYICNDPTTGSAVWTRFT